MSLIFMDYERNRRPNNTVDRWEDSTYVRTVVLGARPVRVATRQQRGSLSVHVTGARLPTARTDITAALARLLGLDVDLRRFYRLASREGRLHELAQRAEQC